MCIVCVCVLFGVWGVMVYGLWFMVIYDLVCLVSNYVCLVELGCWVRYFSGGVRCIREELGRWVCVLGGIVWWWSCSG